MFNLLTDPLFTVQLNDGSKCTLSLPRIYQLAVNNEIQSFRALRPHQWQSWHCFLAQLAAVAMLRAGETELPNLAEHWSELLRGLTPEWPDDQPWQLIVDDWQQPAFMQFPTPQGTEEKYKTRITASDQLDMLVTSKNHDFKIGAALHPSAEDWVYALINLQTTEGFLGAGNYGISRMNGGFSSRCFVGLAPSGGFGAHLSRDILALLRCREDICQTYAPTYPEPNTGKAILWFEQWDGTDSLPLAALDPYYLDCCRRVRFANDSGQLVANTTTSKSARIAAKELNGNTGDPWAPVLRDDVPKALTLDAGGFHYRRIVDLLFGDWVQPPLSIASSNEKKQDMQLVCSAFVRGQGITEGLHQRRIPLGESLMRGFFGTSRQSLGELAKQQISKAAFIQKTLRTAVAVINAAGAGYGEGRVDLKKIKDNHRACAKATEKHFEQFVDATFFPALNNAWAVDGEQREELVQAWTRQLTVQARSLLQEAEHSVPCPQIYRRRAIAAAQAYFNGIIYKEYDWLKPNTSANADKELA